VTVLTRDPSKAARMFPREVRTTLWDPLSPGSWEAEVDQVDAVLNLGAAPQFGQSWTTSYKLALLESRVRATENLVAALAKARRKPTVFVSASATGLYGIDRKGILEEDAEPGEGFFAEICAGWEAAARSATEVGARSAQLRFGSILEQDGMLGDMIGPGRLFVGGPIGSGDNHIPWVHIDDAVDMVLMALDDPELEGPMNVTAPVSSTARELAETVGRVLGRPTVRFPIRLANYLLENKTEIMTGNLQVFPRAAVERGYEFHYTKLLPAVVSALQQDAQSA